MKFIQIILTLLLCFSVTSCNIKKENSEKKHQSSHVYYTTNQMHLPTYGIFDIKDQKYYQYSINKQIRTIYKSTSDPGYSEIFPDDIANILGVYENDSRICIYSYNNSHNYSIKTFDHSMNECNTITFESDELYSAICLNENNEIFTSYNNETGIYFQKFSSTGTLLIENKTVTLPEYTSTDWELRDLVVTKSGNLAVAINSPVGASVYLFNSDLEYIAKITNESINNIYFFSYNQDNLILADLNESDDTYIFYDFDEDTKELNYITSEKSIDSIMTGTGKYDYLISRNGVIYGYIVSSGKEEAICDDENAEGFFSANDTIYYTITKYYKILDIYSEDFSGNVEELFHLDNLDYDGNVNSIKFVNENHIMFLDTWYNYINYIYDLDLKTGKVSTTELKTGKASEARKMLVNTDTVLVYSYDYQNCLDVLTLYDRNGSKLSKVDTKDEFYYFAPYKNNYILVLQDKRKSEYYCALLNSKDFSLTKMELDISNKDNLKPFFRNGDLYLMNPDGVFLIEGNDTKLSSEPVVLFDKTDIPKDAAIDSFYYCNDEIYLGYNNELYKLIPDENAVI